MTVYRIVVARSARKELERLPPAAVARIIARIEGLAAVPRPTGCRKLQGSTDLWRVRVGDHRVIYSVDDSRRVVDVIAVRHRSEAYR